MIQRYFLLKHDYEAIGVIKESPLTYDNNNRVTKALIEHYNAGSVDFKNIPKFKHMVAGEPYMFEVSLFDSDDGDRYLYDFTLEEIPVYANLGLK